ncbi:hypothetical protein IFR05_014852 [Cadophora sp. M221]|nr:hypothetical protein IFR05_014852 [Cadophora sp. M221]
MGGVKKSTALVLREINGPLTIEKVILDQLRPDEAKVDIHASGICHTDLPFVEVGSYVNDFQIGDKVLLSFNHCTYCTTCKEPDVAYCDNFMALNFGGSRPDGTRPLYTSTDKKPCNSNFFGQSSFMRTATVHHSTMVKVPQETDLGLCAPLGCGLQTGAGCVFNTLHVGVGNSIVIFGVGTVGLAAVMAAKMAGASTIIASDLSEARIRLAMELGATQTVSATVPDIVGEVRKVCSPLGVRFAIDETGNAQVIENMLAMLAPRRSKRGSTKDRDDCQG